MACAVACARAKKTIPLVAAWAKASVWIIAPGALCVGMCYNPYSCCAGAW